jgi:tetratricopeptide (TPR) repeat protein
MTSASRAITCRYIAGQLTRVISLAISLWTANLAAQDRIDMRDGKSIAGRIQQETCTQVVIQNTSGTHAVPLNLINQIHYDGQPALLTHARSMEESAQLNQAADEYAKAQAEIGSKPYVLQAARFGEARVRARLALDEAALIDEAIARLDGLEQTNSDSRHHYMTQEFLGRLYLGKKDFTRAKQAFDELSKAPWPEAKLRSAVYTARMLRAQNKLDEAIDRLDAALDVKTGAAEQEAVYCESLLEKAECLRALDRRAAETEVLQQVIDRAPGRATSLQAQAYVALGDAYRAAGKNWDAVWAFLNVQLVFARHEELHARALYNLAQLWSELGRPDRAAAAQAILQTEHPKSSWTKKLGP